MYYVYLLRCRGGVFYGGITTDPARRFREHLQMLPGGARFTRAHPPEALSALWRAPDRSAASRIEYALKKLRHEQKERLAASFPNADGLLPFDEEKAVEKTAWRSLGVPEQLC